MSNDADYLYALELQRRLDAGDGDGDGDGEEEISEVEETDFKMLSSKKPLQMKRSNPHSNLDEDFLNRTQNLVHPQWETLDPTPDVFALFHQFDSKFFQCRLKCVTLEWSKRMYSCAGICYSRRNRYGMDVTIRLSEPLLKLRPRKDLVETMLHEMIHAYCFVLNIREGNGGHGPNFKKIMYAINKVAGTNITVYHTFHDEVSLYKQHWWRCNGVCQDRSPFFGYVKRTSNRAPGPNDQWWAAHQESCGGTFMKIKGPEEKPKKGREGKMSKGKENRKNAASGGSDLRKFFPPQPKVESKSSSHTVVGFEDLNNGFKGPVKSNGGGVLLLNPKAVNATSTSKKPVSSLATAFPPTSYPALSTDPLSVSSKSDGRTNTGITAARAGGNLRNVVSLRDLGDGSGDNSRDKGSTPRTDWGRGHSLSSPEGLTNPESNKNLGQNPENTVARQHLRDIWSKRFASSDGQNSEKADDEEGDAKRRRLSNKGDDVYIADEGRKEKSSDSWVIVDDEVMLQDQKDTVIDLSSSDDEDNSNNSDVETIMPSTSVLNPKSMSSDERQTAIKREIMDESIDLRDEDIELIDDEYNDNEVSAAVELADTSIIDEFFGEDTLLKEFEMENDVVPTSSRNVFNEDNDIITCPICQGKMTRAVFAEHLNGCTGIAVRIQPPKHALKKLSAISREARPTRQSRSTRRSARDILRDAGYTETDLAQIASSSSADDDDNEVEFLSRYGLRSPQSPSKANLNTSEEDESSRRFRLRNIYKTTRQCPACGREIEETEMNAHLDECLSK